MLLRDAMIDTYATTLTDSPAAAATGLATSSSGVLSGKPTATEYQPGHDVDANLMARVAADGDREAFAMLVDRYKDPLVAYLARLTGCREQAQDVAQESFLRLYRAAAKYKDRGYFRAYLFRIATNLVRSQERREQRWRRLTGGVSTSARATAASSEGGSALGAGGPLAVGTAPTVPSWWTGGANRSAEGRALDRELQRLLVEAIAALPLKYRTVLVLSEIEELPHREIAALLGCREGTVKSRLHRARQRLRERLGPYWRSDWQHSDCQHSDCQHSDCQHSDWQGGEVNAVAGEGR